MDYELKIDLFDPGMGPLHRAGVGGLAATIDKIARKFHPGQLAHDDRTVTLKWDKTQGAKGFFQKLYELSFDLKDGLIHLPGTYASIEPSPIVKAILQQALSQTILQFGPNRKSKEIVTKYYEIDSAPMKIKHQYLIGYTHRSAWEDLIDTKGKIKDWVEIGGTIAPGFVQRHVVYNSTNFEVPASHAIALHFALVGTLSLELNDNEGVLIVPDVQDLDKFSKSRGFLTPTNPRECRVSNPADAAIRSQIRLQASTIADGKDDDLGFDRSFAVRFQSQAWNQKQKTRSDVIVIDFQKNEENELDLIRFEVAMLEIAPRVVRPKQDQKDETANKEAPPNRNRSRSNPNVERPTGFWAESVVRPLVAENLAMSRPWYQNFRSLLVGSSGSTDEQRVRQLENERKGLQAMIDEEWNDRASEQIVRSIHEAMNRRFHAIASESNYEYGKEKNKQAFFNKRMRQIQEWRIELVNAKTPDDVRKALGDIWSRSIIGFDRVQFNSVLRDHWQEILPLFNDSKRWMLNRDLALLAISSYSPPKIERDRSSHDESNDDSIEETESATGEE